jgi:hypothetical protein
LTDRPSFAARVDEWTRQSKVFRESGYQEQLGKLRRLQQANNIPDLQRSVRETGIRWYVAHPGDPNVWPAEFRDQPAFESNGYRVYDMSRCLELAARPARPNHLSSNLMEPIARERHGGIPNPLGPPTPCAGRKTSGGIEGVA